MSHLAPAVYVVDDDSSFVAAVSRLLRAAGYVVRTYASAEGLLAEATDSPGCVIADLQMPGLGGLELQEALTRLGYGWPVIFLTGQGDIPTSVRAMRKGAEDFLTKLAPKEELIEAVERALTRDSRQRAERTRMREVLARFEELTPREREVLSHVVRGRLNKQIAADLGIHERTVKLHRATLTTKLHVSSVAELARLVQEAGLFDIPSGSFTKGQ